ncbi:LysR substrate-binding domain-containing protein [Pseudophaeobacter arcticus]
MLDHAKGVLQQAAGLTDLAASLSGSIRGPLSIGCLSTFAQVVLPGLRRSFTDQYSEVRISQIEANQSELFILLRQAKIDVALTYDLDLPRDLSFHPMLSLPPLVALSETHPLADQQSIAIEELADYPMVLLDLPYSADYFLSFFTRAGLRVNIAERTQDMAVMRGLVANGFGYSIVNIRPVNDLAPDGKPMRFLPLSGDHRPMKMGLLSIASSTRIQLHDAFLTHANDWISAHMPKLLKTR